jgi:hypothetical protein
MEFVLQLKNFFEVSTKRTFLIFILLLSIIGTSLSFFYLGVNLYVIPEQITKTTIALNQPSPGQAEKPVSHPNSWFGRAVDLFKIISIDLSAVTPFILLVFFCSSFAGTLKLMLNPEKSGISVPEYFPFPKTHETTWIQLGFIGTLWGFFIIGLRMAKIDKPGVDLIDILTKAFSTAIVSTLTAVVMVYIFCPLLKKSLYWIFDIQVQQPLNLIDQRLGKLAAEISLTCSETEKSRESIHQLGTHLSDCAKQIDTFSSKLEKLSSTEFVNGITKLAAASEKQSESLNALKEKVENSITKEGEMVKNLQLINQNLHLFTDTFESKLEKIIEAFKVESQKKQKEIAYTQEYFQRKVNEDNRFALQKIINILRALIKKTKSSWQENRNETQKTIDQMSREIRVFLETEVIRITDEIKTMNQNIAKIEMNWKSTDKDVAKVNEKWNVLYLGKRKKKGLWSLKRTEDEVEG